MKNAWFAVAAAAAVLSGCASPQQGAIPVRDSGTSVSNQERVGYSNANRPANASTAPSAASQPAGDSGVTVMVPQDAGMAPIQTFPAQSGAAPLSTGPITPGVQSGSVPAAPAASEPSNISATGGFSQHTYQQPVYQQQQPSYQQQTPAAPVQAPPPTTVAPKPEPAAPVAEQAAVPTDPATLERRRSETANAISTLAGVDRAVWSTQSTLLVYLASESADPSNARIIASGRKDLATNPVRAPRRASADAGTRPSR